MVLVICTANQCRSPVVAAALDRAFLERHVHVDVLSAGLLGADAPPPPEVRIAAAKVGIDLSGHRSRPFSVELLDGADVAICMTRRHVREVTVRDPAMWPRTFTLRELVRRAEELGSRRADEDLDAWLDRLHEGRRKADLAGWGGMDDITDPMGGEQVQYDEMVLEVRDLVARLVTLGWPKL